MARPTGGYVKLHRKILNSWIGRDGVAMSTFLTMVMWANRRPGTEILQRQLVKLDRGQLATSATEIANWLDLNRKTVERKIAMMAAGDDPILVQQVSSHGRIITIRNYDKYQPDEDLDVSQVSTSCRTVGAALGAALGAHIGEVEKERSRDLKVPRKKRGTLNKGLSPTAKAKLAVAELVRTVREQVQLIQEGPGFASAREAEEHASHRVKPETWKLLKTQFSSWDQFAQAYARQTARGFAPVFERDQVETFRAIIQGSESEAGAC